MDTRDEGNSEDEPPKREENQCRDPAGSGAVSHAIHHQPISARVSERVARGAHCTGILISDSSNEFVLDFYQSLTRPFQIVARVVVVPPVMEQITKAAVENLNKYIQVYGPPMTLPPPPTPLQRPTLAELYENFKLPEDLLSGVYANNVIIGHSPAEFFMDYITGFYPTAAVSARIIVAPPYLPKMLDTMHVALQQNRKRFGPKQE